MSAADYMCYGEPGITFVILDTPQTIISMKRIITTTKRNYHPLFIIPNVQFTCICSATTTLSTAMPLAPVLEMNFPSHITVRGLGCWLKRLPGKCLYDRYRGNNRGQMVCSGKALFRKRGKKVSV